MSVTITAVAYLFTVKASHGQRGTQQRTRCKGTQVDLWASWNPPTVFVFHLDLCWLECSVSHLVLFLLSLATALTLTWEELLATNQSKLSPNHHACGLSDGGLLRTTEGCNWGSINSSRDLFACGDPQQLLLSSSLSCWKQPAALLCFGATNKRQPSGQDCGSRLIAVTCAVLLVCWKCCRMCNDVADWDPCLCPKSVVCHSGRTGRPESGWGSSFSVGSAQSPQHSWSTSGLK